MGWGKGFGVRHASGKSVGTGTGRARGRRATWHAATWTYRAHIAGQVRAAGPGFPGIASTTKTLATRSLTHIFTHKLNISDMWCADGRSPTRPASERRGSSRADGLHTITGHQQTRGHADTHDRGGDQEPGAITAPAPTLTSHTHTHSGAPWLGRVGARTAAGRARQRAAPKIFDAAQNLFRHRKTGGPFHQPCGKARERLTAP